MKDGSGFTCQTSSQRGQGRDEELNSELRDDVVYVTCLTQGGEADWDGVSTSTGTAQSADHSGLWKHRSLFLIPVSVVIFTISIFLYNDLLLTCGWFHITLRRSNRDGGTDGAEARPTYGQKSSEANRS